MQFNPWEGGPGSRPAGDTHSLYPPYPRFPFSCCFVYALSSIFIHLSAFQIQLILKKCSGHGEVVSFLCNPHCDSVICGWRQGTTTVSRDSWEWRMFISGICFSEPVRTVANGQIRCYSIHDCGTVKTKMTSRCFQLRSPSLQFVCVTVVML